MDSHSKINHSFHSCCNHSTNHIDHSHNAEPQKNSAMEQMMFLLGNVISNSTRLLSEDHELEEHNGTDIDESKLIKKNLVWGMGILTSFLFYILSLVLTIIIVCLVQKNKKKNKKCLNTLILILVSLAIGSLLGDVAIHIIPDVFGEGHDHGHEEESSTVIPLIGNLTNTTEGLLRVLQTVFLATNNSNSSSNSSALEFESSNTTVNATTSEEKAESEKKNAISSLLLVIGFLVCFILGKIFHGLDSDHSHDHGLAEFENEEISEANIEKEGDTQKHSHSEENDNKESKEKQFFSPSESQKIGETKKIIEVQGNKGESKDEENNAEAIVKNENQIPHHLYCLDSDKTQNPDQIEEEDLSFCDQITLKGKKTVGVLLNLSSILHNLIDGIAIGVVFAARKRATIISTVGAITLHEIPKELADAGVLVHSKFPVWGVLFWNTVINLFAVVGAIIGISLGSISDAAEAYCMAFVAGNFLYISLSEMVPLIMKLKKFWNNVIIFAFMSLGFGIMFLILLIEG